MKKICFIILISVTLTAAAQENMHPSPPQQGTIAITNAVVHIGNGQVIENGMIVFSNGKIVDVRPSAPIADVKLFDAKGKHVYPGLIASSTNLGLVEVPTVRATADFTEIGDINSNIHAIYAYNTDSKVINTLRSNGILLANIVPSGASISGSSSVVQLDAWNWEDAAYKLDNGIHYNMPLLTTTPSRTGQDETLKYGLERVEQVKRFFYEAKAYNSEPLHAAVNLKYEAVKGLFDKSQSFFVHCDLVREMMMAIDVAKEFGFKLVIVGGTDSWIIADLLKQNNVAVILTKPHSIPASDDDDVDQPYKTGAALQKAGVLFTICDDSGRGYWRQRNLPFQAGTMAAYGLTKEQALATLTSNAAKILGIDDKTGTLEKGKDANIVISEGDILDMRTNKVTQAFIQGREIDLDNKQKQLFEKYKYKYSIK
ncbi:MAG: amidohydrolase family protein [Ferruginibacter sp.]